MANSSRAVRPKKPRKDFPLFPHASGRWAKKVRGKFAYFGKVADDPKGAAALLLWLDQKDDLLAGRTPRAGREGATVADVCNTFLSAKEDAANAGEITRRTFLENHATCAIIVGAFGKTRLVSDLAADDFQALRVQLAKRFGPVALCNQIQRVRSAFKFGYDSGMLPAPVRFGPAFKRPAKRVLRVERARKGPKMLEARELRRLLKAAGQPLRTMLLLGLNAGFGNADCATLPLAAVDLQAGWIVYPRPKTGIERRVPLWPETVEALREVVASRPKPKTPAASKLVFVTRQGQPWAKETTDNPVSKEARKLLKKLDLHRPGLGFYVARHVFQTVAGECGDQTAVGSIMGHVDESMASVYRERISDERLQRAVNTVRRWLFRRETFQLWRTGAGKGE